MSKPPRIKDAGSRPPQPGRDRPAPARPPAPAAPARLPPLVDRIGGMSDSDLVMLQTNAVRIINTPGHPRHASATDALPTIEAEIGRRTAALELTRKAAADSRTATQRAQRSAASAARAAARRARTPDT